MMLIFNMATICIGMMLLAYAIMRFRDEIAMCNTRITSLEKILSGLILNKR